MNISEDIAIKTNKNKIIQIYIHSKKRDTI